MEFIHNARLPDLARPAIEVVKYICDQMNEGMRLIRESWSSSQWSINLNTTRLRVLFEQVKAHICLLFRTDFLTVESYAAMHGEAEAAYTSALARRSRRLASAKANA